MGVSVSPRLALSLCEWYLPTSTYVLGPRSSCAPQCGHANEPALRIREPCDLSMVQYSTKKFPYSKSLRRRPILEKSRVSGLSTGSATCRWGERTLCLIFLRRTGQSTPTIDPLRPFDNSTLCCDPRCPPTPTHEVDCRSFDKIICMTTSQMMANT